MRRIVLVAFPGVQMLDAAGPAEVFSRASLFGAKPPYAIVLASSMGGVLPTTSGFEVRTTPLDRVQPRSGDTVLIAGGDEEDVTPALQDPKLLRWVRRAAPVVRRIGSVCSGAFVLARAGLLDGHRAATHWAACGLLARSYPAVKVDPNAIFVHEGRLWTSAGVTTGIDMALAMVEEDHGRALADRCAARLVLYARRPGYQSQFTDVLTAQAEAADPLGSLVARARAHLRGLDVPGLARLAGLSARTLHRRCQEHLGVTPAKLLQRLRVEHARTLLSTTTRSLKSIAYDSGLSNSERMRRAFERELGLGPREVRLLFGGRAAA